ncbi:hypothetical protein NPIL_293581 [Nephila pilipes]|uniref:Transmembrane protein n=1 Tax=Nephila pilipes TaxID=299642 RepID=A0A8X6TXS8_NEPPI|nr:hypothetical protein NPIL_293581 [Nephila pilipes]
MPGLRAWRAALLCKRKRQSAAPRGRFGSQQRGSSAYAYALSSGRRQTLKKRQHGNVRAKRRRFLRASRQFGRAATACVCLYFCHVFAGSVIPETLNQESSFIR